MSRLSAEAKAIGVPRDLRRPDPPEHLSRDEKELWTAIVAEKPNDWFQRDSMLLLEAYCRNSVREKFLAAQVQFFEQRLSYVNNLDQCEILEYQMNYSRALKMYEANQKMLIAVATKLRLTPQARMAADVSATKVKKAQKANVPWMVPDYVSENDGNGDESGKKFDA